MGPGRPGTYLLTRRTRFCAGHRLHNPALSEEENRQVYGKCNNPAGHGHNYILEVTVEGHPDPRTGMLVHFSLLDRLVEERVVERMDHKNLNEDVDFLRGTIPTLENLVAAIWKELDGNLPGVRLHEVTLYESEDSYVSYRNHGGERNEP